LIILSASFALAAVFVSPLALAKDGRMADAATADKAARVAKVCIFQLL